MQKTTPPVALMAYKFAEISNAVWKRGANKNYENKLKAHYHYAVATTSEVNKDKLSHITAAVGLHNDPAFLEEQTKITEMNDSVHFETPEELVVPVFTVSSAYAKC